MARPGFDPQRESVVRCEIINENELDVTIPTSVLLQWVPDPSGELRAVYDSEQFRAYLELRAQVQRSFDNRKKENTVSYQRYIERGARGEAVAQTPQILAYSPWLLRTQTVDLPQYGQSMSLVVIPRGMPMVALDGETQRLARQRAVTNVPAVAASMVSVRVLHGVGVEHARQAAHDRNVLGVVASSSDVINLDPHDLATKTANQLAETSEVIRGRVQTEGRSLRGASGSKPADVIMISALRTGVATAFLGSRAMKIGRQPLGELLHKAKISSQDAEALVPEIVERWSRLIEHLRPAILENGPSESVATSPSVFGALGALVNRTLAEPFRQQDPRLTMDEVIELVRDVRWEKVVTAEGGAKAFPWDGVAGKAAANGVFSVGGPGEIGHRVVAALQTPTSDGGRQIRGGGVASIRSLQPSNGLAERDSGPEQLTL